MNQGEKESESNLQTSQKHADFETIFRPFAVENVMKHKLSRFDV